MHTTEEARGRGIGRAMLDHLLGVARERGFRRVSLETGSMAALHLRGTCTQKLVSPSAHRSAIIS
jgi:GNAT superfamily N-acetyltransferase